MKRLLALICALSSAAVMCACQEVPVDSTLAPTEATVSATEAVTDTTEVQTDLTDSLTAESESTANEATDEELTSEEVTEPISVNEDSIKNLVYSNWSQANANAKVQIAQRILTYIESQNGEVAMESSELIAELNSIENANDTDSLLSLSYGILGIEE